MIYNGVIYLYSRYIGAPIDFEVVDIDPNMDNDDDVQYAITTIKRNGVGLKVENFDNYFSFAIGHMLLALRVFIASLNFGGECRWHSLQCS